MITINVFWAVVVLILIDFAAFAFYQAFKSGRDEEQ